MAINYKRFIHPEDAAALKNLENILLLDTILKKIMHEFTEDYMHGFNMASKIRLGPDQLPDLYGILPEICAKLELDEPEFYLEMNPTPNAYTMGDTRPFVVINSGIVDLLSREELKAVVAHECGHILCHHVLYHSLANMILSMGGNLLNMFGINLSAPFEWALFYWVRRSEFSADRVAAYVMEDAEPVIRTMARLAGGPSRLTDHVNIDEFLKQAEEYRKYMAKSRKSAILQNWEARRRTHPLSAIRAEEVRRWFNSFRSSGMGRSLVPGKRLQLEF